jgi:hypothetical protein
MKQVRRRDVLARIIAMIAEEKAKLVEEERLEEGERGGGGCVGGTDAEKELRGE